jgi:hypothetical protein
MEIGAAPVHPTGVGSDESRLRDDAGMDFWDLFWLLLIYVPLLLLWGFTLVDMFRREDLSGLAKSAWIVCIFVLPWIGALVYLTFRPNSAPANDRLLVEANTRAFEVAHPATTTAAQLAVLADLHDRGKLTDEEFAAEKQRLLSVATAAT